MLSSASGEDSKDCRMAGKTLCPPRDSLRRSLRQIPSADFFGRFPPWWCLLPTALQVSEPDLQPLLLLLILWQGMEDADVARRKKPHPSSRQTSLQDTEPPRKTASIHPGPPRQSSPAIHHNDQPIPSCYLQRLAIAQCNTARQRSTGEQQLMRGYVIGESPDSAARAHCSARYRNSHNARPEPLQ